ncbi:SCO family protein [Aquimarina agarilytica]|uniref:SCO family protein n=1 Tax=Aquimarina agarilytica TaxID=1087449 RepID=UPI00028A036D|nr:SCO family protein [Aquimarina agarilytica]
MLNNKILTPLFLALIFFVSCKQKSEKKLLKSELTDTQISTKIDVKKLPYFNTPDFNPTWLPNDGELKDVHKIPSFNFKNQLGNEITNKTLEGKIYVASFFFTTCPNICIQLAKNMRELQEIYAKDDEIKLVSHTVWPSVDTVEVLKEYGERQDINPEKWYLLTGNKEKIYELAREAYFADDLYKQTKDANRFIHTENLILVDKNSHIRGVYSGTLPTEIKRIERHINILKKE